MIIITIATMLQESMLIHTILIILKLIFSYLDHPVKWETSNVIIEKLLCLFVLIGYVMLSLNICVAG